MPATRRMLAIGLVLVVASLAGCLGEGTDEPGTGNDPAGDEAGPDRSDGSKSETAPNGSQAIDDGIYEPGWPAMEDAEIRPGVKVAGGCTANFVFSSPDNRTLYMGTAGHCLADAAVGDEVPVAGGTVEGTLAFAEASVEMDFALVELPAEARDTVHPAVLSFGGPTGVAEGAELGDRLLVFGNSPYRDPTLADDLDDREGYVTEGREETTEYHLYNPTVGGDSGSPVLLAGGQALALHVATSVDAPIEEGDERPCTGCSKGQNLGVAMASAEEAGVPIALKTWPLEVQPQLPAPPIAGQ